MYSRFRLINKFSSLELKHRLIDLVWMLKARRIQRSDSKGYYRAWGTARQEFYQKWGPIACSRPEKRRLEDLHNKYNGERIFILGNGPSLNQTPLEKLDGEYTFGVNRIYLLFGKIKWVPTFYTVTDWLVAPDIASDINSLQGMTFFFPWRFRGMLRTGNDVYWYWKHLGMAPNTNQPIEERFAYDIHTGVRSGGSVLVTAIQLAYHLGFNPIYLLGVDAHYIIPNTVTQTGPDLFGDGIKLYLESTMDDDSNHFDSRYFGKGYRWRNPNVPEMIRGFRNSKDALESKGVKIFNATVGGQLEVFERINFSELF